MRRRRWRQRQRNPTRFLRSRDDPSDQNDAEGQYPGQAHGESHREPCPLPSAGLVFDSGDSRETRAIQHEACIADGAAYRDRQRWDDALDHFREAQRLYRGHYMGEDIHADWCAEERERLHEIHLEMLADMAECHVELGQYAMKGLERFSATKAPKLGTGTNFRDQFFWGCLGEHSWSGTGQRCLRLTFL
ncbi:MAG: hypothetical protein CMM08_19030 [Rhodospirillaceae bacterium]|nr:hypothetical protein [Rhodospirillaceae bacterium]